MAVETEKEIIEDCQNGNVNSFQKLVEKYYQEAFAMAYFWTHNREAALDISQEAFVRIYRHIKKFDLSRPFKAWLFTIVKNLSMNYLKRYRRKRIFFSDLGRRPQTGFELADDFFEREKQRDNMQQLLWGIGQLSETDRDIILLRDIEDYSYQEIADILGIPLGTVMSRLYYARKKLAKILEEENAISE